jgi:hypothetical protein
VSCIFMFMMFLSNRVLHIGQFSSSINLIIVLRKVCGEHVLFTLILMRWNIYFNFL